MGWGGEGGTHGCHFDGLGEAEAMVGGRKGEREGGLTCATRDESVTG